MTANSYHMKHHPAPHEARVKVYESVSGLIGGPLAWFIQLCGGYALATQPCFVNGARASQPLAGLHWTWQAMVVLMVVAVAASLVSFVLSWGAFKRTALEVRGDERHLMETGSGRARFLALWGMVLGGGFAVASAVTAVAFITLPRCAG